MTLHIITITTILITAHYIIVITNDVNYNYSLNTYILLPIQGGDDDVYHIHISITYIPNNTISNTKEILYYNKIYMQITHAL